MTTLATPFGGIELCCTPCHENLDRDTSLVPIHIGSEYVIYISLVMLGTKLILITTVRMCCSSYIIRCNLVILRDM